VLDVDGAAVSSMVIVARLYVGGRARSKRGCWKKNLASAALLRIGKRRGILWGVAPEAGKGRFFGDHVYEQVLDEGRPPRDPDARRVHKGRRRQVWQCLAQSPGYQQATSQRYRVGEGQARLQAYDASLVSNLKRIVKLLTGITLRPRAKGRGAEKLAPAYRDLSRA